MALFDVDNTLVFGEKATEFYRYYSRILEKTLADNLGVELAEGERIANEHRVKFNGRGEMSFQTYNISLDAWYDAIASLEPRDFLETIATTDRVIQFLKDKKIIVGAITDGPRTQVDRILSAAGVDKSNFDFIIGWDRGKQMPKYGSSDIYEKVCLENNIAKDNTVMIGDSLGSDVLPALKAGLKAIHISDNPNINDKYLTLKSIEQLLNLKEII